MSLFISCADDEEKNPVSPKDTAPPYVESISGFTPGMMPNSQVTVTFSEKINPDSITITLQDTSADSSHTLTNFSLENTKLQFTPEVMKFAATYALEIYATDMSDNPIDGNKDGIAGDPYKIIAQTSTPALEIIRYFPVLLSFTREIIGDTTEFKFVTSADSVTYQWSADGDPLEEAVDSTLSFVFQIVKQNTIDVRVTDKYGTQAGLTWNITTKNTRTNFIVNLNDTTYTIGDTIIYNISATDPTILSGIELDWDADGTIDKIIENINAVNYSGRVMIKASKEGTFKSLFYVTDMAGQELSFETTPFNVNEPAPYFSTDIDSLLTIEDEKWEYDFSPHIGGDQSGIHYEVTSSNEEFVKITNVDGTKISGLNTGNYNNTMIDQEGNVVVYIKALDENNDVKDELWLNIGENVKPMTDNSGTVYSVSSDSNEAVAPLEGALVVLLGDSLTTGPDGKYHFQNEPGDVASIFIYAPGHQDREELIGLHYDHERDQFVPADGVPMGYIFETRMQGGGRPLRFPTENDQGIYLINRPSEQWQPYIEEIIENDMPLGSGGTIQGHIVADSSEAFGKIEWLDFQSGTPPGSIYIQYDPDDQTKIIGYTIYMGKWLDGSDIQMRRVSLKEFTSALYGGGDTQLPEHQGLIMHKSPDSLILDLPQGDIDAGVFLSKMAKQQQTGKIPGGYWGNFSDLSSGAQRNLRELVRNNYNP